LPRHSNWPAIFVAIKISSLELLNAYLKRVERFNPTLNAIVVTDIERARKHARAADRLTMRGERLGPLHGVPIDPQRIIRHTRSAKHLGQGGFARQPTC